MPSAGTPLILQHTIVAGAARFDGRRRRRRPLDHVEKIGTMVVRMADRAETELAWAARVAEERLAPLDERWRHTLTVVDRARAFRGVLPDGELETLEAAA